MDLSALRVVLYRDERMRVCFPNEDGGDEVFLHQRGDARNTEFEALRWIDVRGQGSSLRNALPNDCLMIRQFFPQAEYSSGDRRLTVHLSEVALVSLRLMASPATPDRAS